MRKVFSLSILALSLLLLSDLPSSSRATAACTDNDGDGMTTCGTTVNGINTYDCNDNDPYINSCERSLIIQFNPYIAPNCTSESMKVTAYHCDVMPTTCPEPGTPPSLCPERCAAVWEDEYLVRERCV